MHPLLRGPLAGTAATLPMSALMLAAGKLGLVGEQPPESIVRSAVDTAGGGAGQRLPEPVANVMASLVHLGFGAGLGAAYALLPRTGPPAVRGTAVALAVFAGSYQGWVPALNILPAASEDRPDRPMVMAVAHMVFGVVLGTLEDRWRR